MACKGFLECLLKLFNFFLTLVGLAMVGYSIYLFVEYKNASSFDPGMGPSSGEMVQFGRPLLMAVSLSSNILDNLPQAWWDAIFCTHICSRLLGPGLVIYGLVGFCIALYLLIDSRFFKMMHFLWHLFSNCL